MKRDISIQVVRIISMFMIVLCHITEEIPNNMIVNLGQFLNVGVFIFLFISGYLYSCKKIDKKREWLINKFLVLGIPIYIFIIFLSVFNLLMNSFDFIKVLPYLFFGQYFFNSLIGAGHLWFISIIFICYLLYICFLQKLRKKHIKLILLFLFVLAIIVSSVNYKFGMLLFYIFTFVLGYLYKIIENKFESKRTIWVVLFFIGVFLRFTSKLFFDGTFIYDCIFVSITQVMLTISIFNIIIAFVKVKRLGNNNVINWLDSISYYVYVSHYMFMVGPIKIIGMTNLLFLDIILALLFSLITSLVIKLITDCCLRRIRR